VNRDNGSSNSGWLRGMPGVNMSLNQVAGEGTGRAEYDAPLGAMGLVMMVSCSAPGDCDKKGGKSGKANCGCYRIDGKPMLPERARELAILAGWYPAAPGAWICPTHLERLSDVDLANLVSNLKVVTRLDQIRREGGVVLD
jgi:hypothetical protein